MKSLNTWLASLSCLVISAVNPVMAQDNAAETESDTGAKGLFYRQMESPNVPLNTGVQYWIELHRDGETIHANNKTQFHSGDSIRFHVKPNIDGFAYIVLRDGSGEKSQLFPNTEGKIENNHIVRGKEMILPANGTLDFDQNAGTEKLTLLISRKTIDPKAFLNGETEKSDSAPSKVAPQRIAMAGSGSKDLIPNQVLVSYVGSAGGYGSQLKDMPAAQHQAASSANDKLALAGTSSLRPSKIQAEVSPTTSKTTKENFSKDVALKTPKTKPVTTASADVKTPIPTATQAATPAKKPAVKRVVAAAPVVKKKNSLAAGVVTVVYKNPEGVLAADISLEHI